MAKKGSSQHTGKEPLHRKVRNRTKAAFGVKPVAPGSLPHVLHKVPLNYVLYTVLIASMAVTGLVFVRMTKKRDHTDVLGLTTVQAWSVCTSARSDLTVDTGVVKALSLSDYTVELADQNTAKTTQLSWAPEVKLFNRTCIHQPIRKLQVGETVRYYHKQNDGKETIYIIEKSSN
jgi:hypothetical protein